VAVASKTVKAVDGGGLVQLMALVGAKENHGLAVGTTAKAAALGAGVGNAFTLKTYKKS